LNPVKELFCEIHLVKHGGSGACFLICSGKLVIKMSCKSGGETESQQACPDSTGLLIYPILKGNITNYPTLEPALSPANNYIVPGGDR